jgi:hypothetical protein
MNHKLHLHIMGLSGSNLCKVKAPREYVQLHSESIESALKVRGKEIGPMLSVNPYDIKYIEISNTDDPKGCKFFYTRRDSYLQYLYNNDTEAKVFVCTPDGLAGFVIDIITLKSPSNRLGFKANIRFEKSPCRKNDTVWIPLYHLGEYLEKCKGFSPPNINHSLKDTFCRHDLKELSGTQEYGFDLKLNTNKNIMLPTIMFRRAADDSQYFVVSILLDPSDCNHNISKKISTAHNDLHLADNANSKVFIDKHLEMAFMQYDYSDKQDIRYIITTNYILSDSVNYKELGSCLRKHVNYAFKHLDTHHQDRRLQM